MNSDKLKNLIKSFSEQLQLEQDSVLLFNSEDDAQKYSNAEDLEQSEETEITLNFRYYKNQYLLEKYNKMEKIKDFFDIQNILKKLDFMHHICVEFDKQDTSSIFHNFILGTGVLDCYITRNTTDKNKKIFENVEKWSKKDGPFRKEFSKLVKVLNFYEMLINKSLGKEGKKKLKLLDRDESGEHYKYDVSNNPTAADLIKDILCAESLRKENSKDFNDEVYRQLLCKFIEYIIVSRENMPKEEKYEKSLFELISLLRNKNAETTEIAKILVKFLKKYVEEEDKKIIVKKFLESSGEDFASIFNKNSEESPFF